MADEKKRSLEQDSRRGLKRFKPFSGSSGDAADRAGPSTHEPNQQANTPLMPGTGSQDTIEHLGPPHMLPVTTPPNVQSCDNTPNPLPASMLPVPPTSPKSTKRERWVELKALASILGKGFRNFGPLKQAVEGMIAGIETFETAAQNRADYENLRNDLNGLFHDLAEFFDASTPPIMAPSIINFAQGIDQELEIIRRKLSETRIGTHQTDADKILEHYRRIQALLQRLTSNVGFKTSRIADEQATESRLKFLPHSPAAKYRSAEASDLRGQCTGNTRVYVLQDLYEWACSDKSQRVYWLNGMAGTGKTTIAYSFCERLERSKKLAASFFCSRQLPACRDVNRIVPTISYQLSRFSRPFRSAISRLLEEDPDVHNQELLDQFKSLVLRPLGQVKDTLPTDLVVVIDALDECDNNNGVDRMLNALLSCARELPVKFFVASRPDAKILDRMRGQCGKNISTELRLHELDRLTIRGDIETYLSMKLRPYTKLSTADLNTLVERSGVLFVYASTVVRYIGNDNFSRANGRLQQLLSLSQGRPDNNERDMNTLYSVVLDAAFGDSNLANQDRSEMKLVLDTVVCAREPLSVDVMAGLLGLDAEAVQAALRPLFSVLHISDKSDIITTLHESFPDYLLDTTRSGSFHCDANKHNAQLARLCFEQMKVPNPPFNICNLESSYVLDDDIQDLPARVEKAISKQLLYACRYWVVHYMLAKESQNLAAMLHEFVSRRFLLWMEVMNLSGYLIEGVKALYDVRKWSTSAEYLDESMRGFLRDICEFAATFSSTPMALSTPHLYVSTLTFWRGQSPITTHYGQRRIRLITEQSTAMNVRTSLPLATVDAGRGVRCVAYSPDGEYILSGSDLSSIYLWDAHTGQLVTWLDTHTSIVTSFAYSPDGAHIVSGSFDRTIRICNVYTSQPVGQPLLGHTDFVRSVVYSPDGAYIASGSHDKTIRIWDAHTGQPVGQPLEGHTNSVASVAYSPGGAYIISGSDDDTIRIWDTHTGRLVGQPLEGHTKSVTSVAYSPNGAYIVSGSRDRTIRIWDAHSRQLVGLPLKGHTDSICSVAYSPDCVHFVSSSADMTIRIWDAHSRQAIGQPLEGHTGPDISVAYSPDGLCIVSGSSDRTIRIWDAHISQPAGQQLEGHTRSVTSVAYSPDGAYLVSGSEDMTIRIWDARTRQAIEWLRVEKNESVNSIVDLPNGEYVVFGSSDSTVRIWSAHDGNQPVKSQLEGYTDADNYVAYSPDGAYIVTGADPEIIHIRDAHTGQLVERLLKYGTDFVCSKAYSPDSASRRSISEDTTIRIWDAHTGQLVGQPLKGHTSPVHSVAYSPDGAYIVSGSEDGTIRIWDARTNQLVEQPLEEHIDSTTSATYSSDDAHNISDSLDETVRTWDTQSVISRAPRPSHYVESQTIHPLHNVPIVRSTERLMSCNLGCQTDCPHVAWTLDNHGWIVFQNDKLIWVPPDLREILLRPQNTGLISTRGFLQLDLDRNKLGKNWHEYFQPGRPND